MGCNTIFVVPPTKSFTVSPPLGLLYLATVLQKNEISVKIIDSLKDNLSENNLYKIIEKISPKNIGLSIMTPRFNSVTKFVSEIRKRLPNVKIILGGPHASALPMDTFQKINPDVLVKGEAENIIYEIITALNENNANKLQQIPGIIFRNKQIIETAGHNQAVNVNELPALDWSLLPPKEYPPKPANLFYKKFPIGSIITSRGCKYSCPFCATKAASGNDIRYRNVKQVIEEIKTLTERYGVREIHFLDDNFVNNKEHAYNICKELIEQEINIVWKVPGGLKINDLDDTLIDIFKRSGCYQLGFGIETLDPEVQKQNRKVIDIEKSIQIINKLRKAQIESYGYFILGLPGETKQTVKNTFRLLRKFAFDYYHFSLFTPMPGSEYFQDFQPTKNWDEYLFSSGTKQSYCFLSPQELKKYQRQALLISALNLRMLLKIFSYIKLRQIKYFIDLILNYWRK